MSLSKLSRNERNKRKGGGGFRKIKQMSEPTTQQNNNSRQDFVFQKNKGKDFSALLCGWK